jgi:hypothetical protein
MKVSRLTLNFTADSLFSVYTNKNNRTIVLATDSIEEDESDLCYELTHDEATVLYVLLRDALEVIK